MADTQLVVASLERAAKYLQQALDVESHGLVAQALVGVNCRLEQLTKPYSPFFKNVYKLKQSRNAACSFKDCSKPAVLGMHNGGPPFGYACEEHQRVVLETGRFYTDLLPPTVEGVQLAGLHVIKSEDRIKPGQISGLSDMVREDIKEGSCVYAVVALEPKGIERTISRHILVRSFGDVFSDVGRQQKFFDDGNKTTNFGRKTGRTGRIVLKGKPSIEFFKKLYQTYTIYSVK